MTTDTVPKGASRRVVVDGVPVTVTGIAKGAGMIHPNMATMLGVHGHRRADRSAVLRAASSREVADVSFNGATVDGDTSTNDSFVLAATGKAALAPIDDADDPRLAPIRAAIEDVAIALAQAIVRDGEGATKFITIRVEGGRDVDECQRVAFGIAHSPLVKTAFFASDPNLGRIVCAIGNAGVAGPRSRRRVVLARRRAGRRPRRPRGDLPRGGRPARDEAGARSPCASTSAAARPRPPSGPAICRTTT